MGRIFQEPFHRIIFVLRCNRQSYRAFLESGFIDCRDQLHRFPAVFSGNERADVCFQGCKDIFDFSGMPFIEQIRQGGIGILQLLHQLLVMPRHRETIGLRDLRHTGPWRRQLRLLTLQHNPLLLAVVNHGACDFRHRAICVTEGGKGEILHL